jgi:hypothetical protein
MPPVLVRENIGRIENAISKFTEELSHLEKRKEEIKIERTRLEGCLITFEGFARAGIEEIVPEHEKNKCDHQQMCDREEPESSSDPRAHTHDHEEPESSSDPRTHTHDHEEPESSSDPRTHTHDHEEHDKTPLEELYSKYRTM